jgi:hypothetical protein
VFHLELKRFIVQHPFFSRRQWDGVRVNREALKVETGNKMEAIENAVGSLLDEEARIGAMGLYCYATLVSVAFEKISLLRQKGIRYDKIRESFTRHGLLPANAKTHSLSQAFLREKRRRERHCPKPDFELPGDQTKAGESLKGVSETVHTKPNDDAKEHERIRKMTGVTVDTGLGQIVKHSDGTFDIP